MGRLLFLVQTQMPPYSRREVFGAARYSARYQLLLVYRWRLGDDDRGHRR